MLLFCNFLLVRPSLSTSKDASSDRNTITDFVSDIKSPDFCFSSFVKEEKNKKIIDLLYSHTQKTHSGKDRITKESLQFILENSYNYYLLRHWIFLCWNPDLRTNRSMERLDTSKLIVAKFGCVFCTSPKPNRLPLDEFEDDNIVLSQSALKLLKILNYYYDLSEIEIQDYPTKEQKALFSKLDITSVVFHPFYFSAESDAACDFESRWPIELDSFLENTVEKFEIHLSEVSNAVLEKLSLLDLRKLVLHLTAIDAETLFGTFLTPNASSSGHSAPFVDDPACRMRSLLVDSDLYSRFNTTLRNLSVLSLNLDLSLSLRNTLLLTKESISNLMTISANELNFHGNVYIDCLEKIDIASTNLFHALSSLYVRDNNFLSEDFYREVSKTKLKKVSLLFHALPKPVSYCLFNSNCGFKDSLEELLIVRSVLNNEAIDVINSLSSLQRLTIDSNYVSEENPRSIIDCDVLGFHKTLKQLFISGYTAYKGNFSKRISEMESLNELILEYSFVSSDLLNAVFSPNSPVFKSLRKLSGRMCQATPSLLLGLFPNSDSRSKSKLYVKNFNISVENNTRQVNLDVTSYEE